VLKLQIMLGQAALVICLLIVGTEAGTEVKKEA